jgi:hypothetical protein
MPATGRDRERVSIGASISPAEATVSLMHPSERLARLACDGRCRPDPERRAHHDRLLRAESDPDAMVDLFETAVTWAELEYSPRTIPPHEWIDFAESHRWHDADRMLWIFGLATDMALRGAPAADREPAALGLAAGSEICPAPVEPRRHLRVVGARATAGPHPTDAQLALQ